MLCNNCSKNGHVLHQCKLPIISCGIILLQKINNVHYYLMIRRKDSFGYIDFLRGKYLIHNKNQLQNIFNEMSVCEKEQINNFSFENLWKLMWGDSKNLYQYKKQQQREHQKRKVQIQRKVLRRQEPLS